MLYSAFDTYIVNYGNKMGQCTDSLYTSINSMIRLGGKFRRSVTFSLNLASPWTSLSIIKNIIKRNIQ